MPQYDLVAESNQWRLDRQDDVRNIPNGQPSSAPKEGDVHRNPRVGRLTTVHRGGVERRTSHRYQAVAISTKCTKSGSAPRHLCYHAIDETRPPKEADGEGLQIAMPENEPAEKGLKSNPNESPHRWKSKDIRRASGDAN